MNSDGQGKASGDATQPQQPQQQQPQHRNYNTLLLAPPLTARTASEQQRKTERAGLLRRLSSGSNSSYSSSSFHRHRSADGADQPALLRSPYVADYKTMAMEMAYLTPRRKASSVRLPGGSSQYPGLFSGAGGASPAMASGLGGSGAAAASPVGGSLATTVAAQSPEQRGFFRLGAGSAGDDHLAAAAAAAAATRSPAEQQRYNPGVLTLALFAASILFLFADQNLLAPNLTAVARDFGFDDAQRDIKLGGQIPFAFFVVGGVVSVVVGPLADIFNRKHLYVLTCLVGTIPCLLTYWVKTFEQFFFLRTLTGVAVGGAFPLIYSLASDITTPEQRALASSMITISMGLGGTLGQGVAGFLGPRYGWRLPFVVIALPSVLVIALVMLTMREPPRSHHAAHHHHHHHHHFEALPGASPFQIPREEEMPLAEAGEDGAEVEEKVDDDDEEEEEEEEEEDTGPSLARNGCSIQLQKFMAVFVIRTNLLAFCQSFPGCLPWGVISAFLTDFLHEQRGMTVEGATALMFVFGIGCFAGNLAGGIVGQWVYNRSREGAALLMAGTTALGYIPMAWLINASPTQIRTSSGGFTLLAAAVAASGGIAAFTGPLVRAFVMQVNTSQNRGTVFSVFMVADDLGKGLGPAVVSLLIPSLGRATAFNLSLGGWFLCSFFLFCMVFTIAGDEEAAARAAQQHQAEALMARLKPVIKVRQERGEGEGKEVSAETAV